MIHTEVVTLKSRTGKTLESVRDAFDDACVNAGATVIRNMLGRVIIYDFSTWKATFWRPGNPENRKTCDIIKINLDK